MFFKLLPWQTKVLCLKCVQALSSQLYEVCAAHFCLGTLSPHILKTLPAVWPAVCRRLSVTRSTQWEPGSACAARLSHTYALTLIPLIKEAWPITQCQSGPASHFPALTVLTAPPMQPGSPSGGIIQFPPLNNSVPALECTTQAISDNSICSF